MENQLVGALLLENNRVEVSYISDDIDSISFTLTRDGKPYSLTREKKQNVNQVYTLTLVSGVEIDLGHSYKVKTSEEEETYLRIDKYVSTKEFDEKYAYDGELGIKYSKAETAQDREQAKKNLIGAIVGFLIIFVLIVTLKIVMPILENWVESRA